MSSQQTQRVSTSPAAQVTQADVALARQTLDHVQTQYGVLLSSVGTLTPGDTAALFTQLTEIKQVIMASDQGADLRGLCASLMAALQSPASSAVLAPVATRLPPMPPLATLQYRPSMQQENVRSPLAASLAEGEDSSLLKGSQKEQKQPSSSLWSRLSRRKEASKETDEFTSLLRAHPDSDDE